MRGTVRSGNIKTRIGIGLVVAGFLLPLLGLIVPFLGFSSGVSATLIGFFMIGGPEIFIILGGALAGKEGVLLVKNRAKRFLGLPEGEYPASRSQYNLALFLMVLWLVSLTLPYYVPFIGQWIGSLTIKWYYFVLGDLVFVVAFLFLGGHQMIIKLGKLFTWEPWELPE